MGTPRFSYALFDLDGTIVDEKSSWEWVHDHFGVDNSDNVRAYLDGYLDDRAFMASDIALWQDAKGGPVHIAEVSDILADAPLMPGAEELFYALRQAGLPTAIVSGGIDLLADRVADEHGVQRSVANSLATDDQGMLTGKGVCRVALEDKATPAKRLLDELGWSPGQGVGIGNSRYDVDLFEIAGFGIAFAPLDETVRKGADVVVDTNDMRELIPHLVEGEA